MTTVRLLWDVGTAYDLFVSLWILHQPADFGLHRAWAAGVRARLLPEEREVLEQSQELVHVPFSWIYTLPEPKDASAVLWTLSQLPARERLQALVAGSDWLPPTVVDILRGVADRGRWEDSDREALAVAYRDAGSGAETMCSAKRLDSLLDWWARSEEFGKRYLAALRAYQDAFFAEEERRIAPALHQGLARAQELAARLDLLDLLEELSHGLRFEAVPEVSELVLAPSYWSTPLMFFGMLGSGREIRLFGARPLDASLVPGEVVPDALLQALKALSDPTRLRILRYLTQESLTPAELARRLRLRAPTVTHHLQALRLAGLVQLKLGLLIADDGKDSRRYATRPEGVKEVFDSLRAFLEKGDN